MTSDTLATAKAIDACKRYFASKEATQHTGVNRISAWAKDISDAEQEAIRALKECQP